MSIKAQLVLGLKSKLNNIEFEAFNKKFSSNAREVNQADTSAILGVDTANAAKVTFNSGGERHFQTGFCIHGPQQIFVTAAHGLLHSNRGDISYSLAFLRENAPLLQ